MGNVSWNNPPCFGFLVSNEWKNNLPYPSSNKIACTLPWTFLYNCSSGDALYRGVVCFCCGWRLGKNQVHGVEFVGLPLFANCGTVLRLLPRPWAPPHAWGFYIPLGLVHLLVAGCLEIFSGRLVVISFDSALQCGCVLLDLIGMMHHCQCEVSYR